MSGCHRQTSSTRSTSNETTASTTKTGGRVEHEADMPRDDTDTPRPGERPSRAQRCPGGGSREHPHQQRDDHERTTATGTNAGGASPLSRPPWSNASRAPVVREAHGRHAVEPRQHGSAPSRRRAHVARSPSADQPRHGVVHASARPADRPAARSRPVGVLASVSSGSLGSAHDRPRASAVTRFKEAHSAAGAGAASSSCQTPSTPPPGRRGARLRGRARSPTACCSTPTARPC